MNSTFSTLRKNMCNKIYEDLMGISPVLVLYPVVQCLNLLKNPFNGLLRFLELNSTAFKLGAGVG